MPKIKYPIENGLKKCADCSERLPVKHFRKARKHLTSRCVACLKVYAAKYRQRPESRKKSLAYSRHYRKNAENRKRLNDATKIWRMKPESKRKRNAARRNWTRRQKEKAIEYKGGKCVGCGYNACLAALEFHHPDPAIKEMPGSGALVPHRTFEQNIKELDKCVLICVRCHREVHANARKI